MSVGMNKSESKYFNTARRMDEAFLALLEHREFAYITVKDICERAGVNRSTFYLHYESLSDLLEESVGYVNGQFLAYFGSVSGDWSSRLRESTLEELYFVTPQYLAPYLNYIRDNKRLFQTLIRNAGTLRMDRAYDEMFRSLFSPILERHRVPEQERPYIMAFFIQGLMAMVAEWLRGDCALPPERLIGMIRQCIMRPQDRREEI
ncbi:MAG: TetR/AcrR family transcriptional regulator [Candidatus Fimadaptatus sp.]